MTFPVRPLADRVIIKILDKKEEKSPGGIVMPGMSAKFKTAEVVAVGRGQNINGVLTPPEVQPGDIVQIPAHGNVDEIVVENEKYAIMPERLISVVIGNNPATQKKQIKPPKMITEENYSSQV